jgi:hypothetical protein
VGVSDAAFSDVSIVGILAGAIASALSSPGGVAPSVTVLRITDVATGAALYRAPGAVRRILQASAAATPAAGSAGVRVDFTVAGASAAALSSSLSAGGGASSAAFASAVVASAQSLAQTAGSASLTAAFGAASAFVVAAATSPSPAATRAATATGGANTVVWAIVGVLVALAVAGFALIVGYRFWKRSHAAAMAPGKEASAPRIIGGAAPAFEVVNPFGEAPSSHHVPAQRLEIRRPAGALGHLHVAPQPYAGPPPPQPPASAPPARPSRFVVQPAGT